jgi:hypothetical protein
VSTITQVHEAIATVIEQLGPYIIALTPSERQSTLKMGDKSLAFVEKARGARTLFAPLHAIRPYRFAPLTTRSSSRSPRP